MRIDTISRLVRRSPNYLGINLEWIKENTASKELEEESEHWYKWRDESESRRDS